MPTAPRQKLRLMVRSAGTPISMSSGVGAKMPSSCLGKIQKISMPTAIMEMPIISP